MIKRIVKHGGGRAIALDKALLDILKIDENTDLEITTDGVGLMIYPVANRMSDEKFHAAKARTLKQQAETIDVLAREPLPKK